MADAESQQHEDQAPLLSDTKSALNRTGEMQGS